MIILDEQLQNPDIITAIQSWYSGTVIHVRQLRPNSVIKDDNIATLLHAAQRPVFVTINVDDFWCKLPAHANFCIIAIDLVQESAREVPRILRQVFSRPELKTRTLRLGKVIRVRKERLSYYSFDGQIYDFDS